MKAIPPPTRRTPTGRERVIPTLLGILEALDEMNERLARMEARTPQIIVQEWRPNHRRLAEGGEHVKKQRKRMARTA